MAKLRRVSGDQTVEALRKLGFEQVRQRGSHVVMKKQLPEDAIGCVVPMHKELAVGTLSSILRQAKVSADQFLEQL
jgi:predicted RNA binding protein YcfA (HicA-like mRNA interferase family)